MILIIKNQNAKLETFLIQCVNYENKLGQTNQLSLSYVATSVKTKFSWLPSSKNATGQQELSPRFQPRPTKPIRPNFYLSTLSQQGAKALALSILPTFTALKNAHA